MSRKLNDAEKVSWRRSETREDSVECASSKVIGHDLREHRAKVGRESEIATLVELLLLEPGPTPVHLAAFDLPADHEQGAGMTVISAAIAVLAGHAAELGHRENHDVVHPVTEVGDQRGNGTREIIETLRELAS